MDWLVILALVTMSRELAGPAHARWPIVIDGLDTIRSQAFEQGRTDLLSAVYPDGSSLLAHDEALLASYVSRGIDIERMRMRVLEADVRKVQPGKVTVDVVDQLAQASIRLSDGTERDLPRDQPTRRVVELTLTAGGWRISAVNLRP